MSFNSKLISNEEILAIKNKVHEEKWSSDVRRINSASLILTENCNLRCIYCFENEKRNTKCYMTPDVAISSIEYLIKGAKTSNRNNISVTFFGGEPMLNIDIMELIYDYGMFRCKEENLYFDCGTITNATILTERHKELFRRMYRENKLLNIQLSIDGIPEIQNHNRPTATGNASAELVEKNISEFLALRDELNAPEHSIHVHSVISRFSLPKMYESYQYFRSLGIEQIWFMPCHEEEWTDEDVEIFKEEKQKIADFIYEKCIEDGNTKWLSRYSSLSKCKSKHPSKPCGAGESYATITTNGDVHPCHHIFFNDTTMKFGNSLLGTDETSKRQFFLDYTSESLFGDKPCGECDNYSCYRCIATNYVNNGNMQIGFPQYCKLSRVEDAIRKELRDKLVQKGLLKETVTKKSSCNGDSCNCDNKSSGNDDVMLNILTQINDRLEGLSIKSYSTSDEVKILNEKVDNLMVILLSMNDFIMKLMDK